MNCLKKVSRAIDALLLLTVLLLAADSKAAVQVNPGEACSTDEGSYLWITSSRTEWSISEVYAVPTGATDPEAWSESASFQARLGEVLPSNANSTQYANACASIWNEFFSEEADVLVNISRTFNSIKKKLECVSSVWTVTSQSEENVVDESGWSRVGEQSYNVTIEASRDALVSDLQELLSDLNGQPGSTTTAFERFVKLEE